MNNIIFEDDDLLIMISNYCKENKHAVIFFSPRIANVPEQVIDSNLAFSKVFFDKYPFTGIYIIPKWNHWYETENFDKAISAINNYTNLQDIWTYGVSMGAYGAMRYAEQLNASGTISICPQASINKHLIPFEKRWGTELAKLNISENWMKLHKLAKNTYVFYDSKYIPDKRHVDLLKDNYSFITEVKVDFAEHAVAGVLLECGLLKETVLNLIYGNFYIESFLSTLKSQRTSSPGIYCGFSNYLRHLRKYQKAQVFSKKSFWMRAHNKELQKNVTLTKQTINEYILTLVACKAYDDLNMVFDNVKNYFSIDIYKEIKNQHSVTIKNVESGKFVESNDTFIGGAHVHRWLKCIKDGIFPPEIYQPFDAYGAGGIPVWSKKLYESAGSLNYKSINLIVGDFRYGNAVLTDNKATKLMLDGYAAVTTSLINSENDILMMQRCLSAIKRWNEKFHGALKIVFWDLFFKQYNHLGELNKSACELYADVISKHCEFNVVDFQPLHKYKFRGLRRLFIDNSYHPSYIGCLFLHNLLIENKDVLESYCSAVSYVDNIFLNYAKQITEHSIKPVLILGDSIWISSLLRYLCEQSYSNLASAGLFICNIDDKDIGRNIQDIRNLDKLGTLRIVLISPNPELAYVKLANKTNLDKAIWQKVKCINWEAKASHVIKNRKQEPRFSFEDKNDESLLVDFSIDDTMLEFDPFGTPTFTGLISLLDFIKKNDFAGYLEDNFQLANDVLVSRNGIAYLIGGHHSVLEFVTGKNKPPVESVLNFWDNIKRRNAFSGQKNIEYSHVIFPDKQSVLDYEFPIRPLYRLGEHYFRNVDDDLKNKVIYPINELKELGNAYLPLDTHLSDFGSLKVLELLLKSVGINATDTVKHISSCINKKQKWAGDLGGKLTPKMYQEGMILNPDWRYEQFKSPGGFNDGMVDIIISPDALLNETILLFGDSFFRMMLKHFSAIFKKVICLRTRFYHKEMIELVKPGYIFTGNAERYLSNVTSDKEAHAFSLYSYLRNEAPAERDNNFIRAFRAFTSPESDFSKNYFLSKDVK